MSDATALIICCLTQIWAGSRRKRSCQIMAGEKCVTFCGRSISVRGSFCASTRAKRPGSVRIMSLSATYIGPVRKWGTRSATWQERLNAERAASAALSPTPKNGHGNVAQRCIAARPAVREVISTGANIVAARLDQVRAGRQAAGAGRQGTMTWPGLATEKTASRLAAGG